MSRSDSSRIKIIDTGDGSHSLYDNVLNETYHSRHGARRESMHVFIASGLKKIAPSNSPICILEVGYGTGLNAFLTAIESRAYASGVHYTTLETNPLDATIYNQLNYALDEEKELFNKIQEIDWEKDAFISDHFTILKKQVKVQDFATEKKFDLVYYDAFGPPTQPEMWTKEIFERLYHHLNTGGIFVTYCAKGQVRRDLESCGFKVERLPGPPGKREMLRATKP